MIPDLPDVRRQRIERDQLARVRPLERDLEVGEEGIIGRDVGRNGAGVQPRDGELMLCTPDFIEQSIGSFIARGASVLD